MVYLEPIGHLTHHVVYNKRPVSMTNILGQPNLVMIFSYNNIVAFLAVSVFIA